MCCIVLLDKNDCKNFLKIKQANFLILGKLREYAHTKMIKEKNGKMRSFS